MIRSFCLSSLFLVSFFSSLTSAANNQSDSQIKWTNCTTNDPPNLSCGTFDVPIDWDKPHGAKVQIFMARLAAAKQTSKIGSLIFNPGGPGEVASGILIDLAAANISLFPTEFDIIAPDPRGVGQSHPLQCDPTLWNSVVTYTPATNASFDRLVKHNQALGASCRNLTGPLFNHLDSASVAKDFNAIRRAVGDDKLTYLGISYGTVIGQSYAELFPDKIRALALDGNIEHSYSTVASISAEASTYEDVINQFAKWCAATSDCPLHGTSVRQLVTNLTSRADYSPIPAPSCISSGTCRANVTAFDIRSQLSTLLFFADPHPLIPILTTWSTAAAALASAAKGDASALSAAFAQSSLDPAIYSSGLAQLCQDWDRSATSISDLRYFTQAINNLAPTIRATGGVNQQWIQAACLGWPAPVQYSPSAPRSMKQIQGLPPVLLTNAYHDPATPYAEAVALRSRIDGAVLATRNGNGHTSFFLGRGDTYDAIVKYLITLETPAPNTVFNS